MTARGRKRAEGAVVSPTVDLRLAFTTDRVRLYHGDHDLHDVTRVLAPESIDAIVTDPPSGIEFMGKSWDSDKGGRDHWIAWLAGIMRRAMVVLKPGGHALVWALPRTSHWTATAVEDAGFEIRDVVMHLFGSGFPKSLDVSKAIDFAGGESPADAGDSLRARREAAGMSVDDLAEAVGCSPVSIRNWEDGRPRKAGGAIERIVPSAEYRARLREVVGYSVDERAAVGSVVQRSGDGSVIGLGHTGTMRSGGMSRAAAEWSGWGTALKPAAEHWILARKPLSGTVAANVLAFGTGALNIDGCRIGMAGEVIRAPQSNPSNRVGAVGEVHTYARIDAEDMQRRQREATERTNALGRWPANVTLSHLPACGEACADGCAVAMLDAQSGVLTSGMMRAGTPRGPQGGVYEKGFTGRPMAADTFGDAGGASRFFYVAKPARSEKDAGLDHLPLRTGGEATDREEGSAGLNNPRAGAGRGGGVRNHHPTVKSIELMRWLCRLITPPGGTVLDLFAGSGTTGLAALREGFKFIGVERDPGFIDVAAGRLAHVECVAPPPVSDEASEVVSPVQPSLFGGA